MHPNPLDQQATPAAIQALEEEGRLSPQAARRAMTLLGAHPDTPAWRAFIERSLLLAGVGLVLSGIIFFFAYNWAALSRFTKFGLLEALILGAVAFGSWRGLEGLSGQASLLAAAVLVGPLLAVYGQTYQTGADPYQLFLFWSLLIFGWVAISRFAPAWFLLLLLLNVTLPLFWKQALGSKGSVYSLCLASFVLNGGAFVAWEAAARRLSWLDVKARWAQRTIFLYLAATLTVGVFIVIIERTTNQFAPVLVVTYIVGLLVTLIAYQRKEHVDFFVLSMSLLSAIILLTTFAGKQMRFRDIGTFFILGFFVIAQAVAATFWLRKVERSCKA